MRRHRSAAPPARWLLGWRDWSLQLGRGTSLSRVESLEGSFLSMHRKAAMIWWEGVLKS